MAVDIDKSSIHQTLLQPVRLFGYPKVKDKIELLNYLKSYVDLSDVEYVYPLVFEKNSELSAIAAQEYHIN